MSRAGTFGFLSRRKFLASGLGGASVLLMGGGGLWALRGSAPVVSGLGMLTAHEYRTLRALADAHLPPGGGFPLAAEDVDLARAFDSFLADEPEENVRDLKRALLLVEYGPVVFDRRPVTFSNLPLADRIEHWQSWAFSQRLIRRQVAIAFRKFLALVFYDRPEAWRAVGYPGPAVGGFE
jgi:hypothetical protein